MSKKTTFLEEMSNLILIIMALASSPPFSGVYDRKTFRSYHTAKLLKGHQRTLKSLSELSLNNKKQSNLKGRTSGYMGRFQSFESKVIFSFLVSNLVNHSPFGKPRLLRISAVTGGDD